MTPAKVTSKSENQLQNSAIDSLPSGGTNEVSQEKNCETKNTNLDIL